MNAAHSPVDATAGDSYCATPAAATRPGPPPAVTSQACETPDVDPVFADCVYCGKPTEYLAAQPGVTLCPVCEWQEDQRGACSG